MTMTTAQLQSLKTAIAANTNLIIAALDPIGTFVGQAINAISPAQRSQEGAGAIAAWYNLPASPAFLIFNSAIPMSVIANQILWANYTPNDAITTSNDVQWTACSLACQGKQKNLENMGINNPSALFDATLVNLRKGLKDATTGLPSGTSFAISDGGWAATLGFAPGPLTRSATNFEALFAVASTGPFAGGTAALGTGGAQGVSNVSVPATDASGAYLQGPISFSDVFNAWSS